jgi:hypothetical protein
MISELVLSMMIAATPQQSVNQCVRWAWTGPAETRTVICVEYRRVDCSQRLYPQICKAGT